jgi:hypothetical protein
MESHLYLVKDSDTLISYCRCKNALIGHPAQMDCPWCGCGWLFNCLECTLAFSFARAIEITEPWESLAHRNLTKIFGRKPTLEQIEDWCETMQDLHADVEYGERYVNLDGYFIPADSPEIAIDGWYARHELPFVPQVEALSDTEVIDVILANPQYWKTSAVRGATIH